ncbi:MAG: alpha/beta fold hydrolase [Acidobacteria bacterium]|nr:alpha/beta fold hydrolase [Acidobacteriota bacterium]
MVLRFAGVLLCCSALFPAEVTPGPAPAEVYVKSFDAAYVTAAIRKPPSPGPLPAILFIHGGVGGGDMPAMKASTRQPVLEHFYKLGYVVMSADYRRYHFGEDEIQDILAAYRKLESYPFVDKSRIAIIGGSHGGYLALMLATRIQLNAVVSMAGLVDIEDMFFDYAQEFRKTIKDFDDWREKLVARSATRPNAPDTAWGKIPKGAQVRLPAAGTPPYQIEIELAWRFGDRRELYRAIAPKDNAARITSPVLFVVGGEDKLRFAGKALIDDLRKRGVTAEYSEHAGMPHGFYTGLAGQPPQYFDALKVMTAFVERHLNRGPK